MKISWNWLSDYVDLSDLEVAEVAERLTMSGLEVEGVERLGDALEPVVVGEILGIAPHPGADRLTLCQVTTGGEPLSIVCGASNMREGDRVPVIPAGQRLPDGTKIKRGKIRGELSEGMMCSASELGLGDDEAARAGLLILPDQAPVGASVARVLGLSDWVIDIGLTPNRGDCASYLGVAREVAALFGRERRYPGVLGQSGDELGEEGAGRAEDLVEVVIDDPEGCPRYAAAVVRDVTVGPSPEWLARRLLAIGQRPVNNLVDVTNYVMFETGQPLHAFDWDKLGKDDAGRAVIRVRRAEPGETLTSIDHVERLLGEDDVVIADAREPVAVAGVMGGVETEVSESTRHLLLECAHFDPRRIRRSGRRLGMSSESSYRFERGVDPEGVLRVLRRTVELVVASHPAGASGARPRVAQGLVDVYPRRWEGREVSLRPGRCRELLGLELSRQQMVGLLETLDISVEAAGGGGEDEPIRARPPSFRWDLEREVDLIEEVGRLYGIDRIEATLPLGALGQAHEAREDAPPGSQTVVGDATLVLIERLRDRLADAGLREAVNYAFVPAEAVVGMGFEEGDARRRPVAVKNPLSEEWAVMRTTLLPGLLANARHNWGHQERSLALFEMGPVFFEDPEGETGTREEQHVAVLLMGHRPSQPLSDATPYDGLDLKAVLLALCAEVGVGVAVTNHQGRLPELHPGVGAEVLLEGAPLGGFGQLHPDVGEAFDLPSPVYVLEMSLAALLAAEPAVPQYQPVARFPAATRDVALVVSEETPYSAIDEAVARFSNPLVESVALSSLYRGAPIPEGKQSVALSITYRSPKGSLTDAKVDAVHERLVAQVMASVGAERR